MKTGTLAIALLCALAAPAAAQDGGKLNWKGKDQDTITATLEAAVRDGRPMLIFFSVAGNKECIALCAGAFSDPEVVSIASEFTCIFVDCSPGRKNSAVAEKLKISEFPKVLFFDTNAKPVGEVTQRDGPQLAAAMKDFSDRVAGRPPYLEDVVGAMAAARKQKMALLIYFYDDSPGSLNMSQSLNDPELISLHPRFLAAKTRMTRGSAVCDRFDVSRAPTLLVLDPLLPKPEDKPLARISTSRTPRELRRDLEDALNAFKGAPANPAADAPSIPAPREKLSDDEVDRKFIQARINFALDLRKQGNKAKAIEVLEDVVKSFPKHVLTEDARTLLEQLKK